MSAQRKESENQMTTTRRGFFGQLAAAFGLVVGGTCLTELQQLTTETDHYPDQGWPRHIRDNELVIWCDNDITPGGSETRIDFKRWRAEEGSNFTLEKRR